MGGLEGPVEVIVALTRFRLTYLARMDLPPWTSAFADQKDKIIHLLGSNFSDHNCDKGAEETQMDCITSEERSPGAAELTK